MNVFEAAIGAKFADMFAAAGWKAVPSNGFGSDDRANTQLNGNVRYNF